MLLSVSDEAELLRWRDAAGGLPCSLVIEPDIGDEATALAVAPPGLAGFSSLPLLGKEPAMP